ncbi:DUF2812 domain-containing protein [Vagococcus elongatus]
MKSGYGSYQFTSTTNKNSIIKIDVRKFSNEIEKIDYIQFLEDSYWTSIPNNQNNGKFYFIGDKTKVNELFSDNESKYEREVRARNGLISTNFVTFIFYLLIYYNDTDKSVLMNFKNAFFTPGIWQKEGAAFKKVFLFELPLASMRIFFSIFPILLLFYFCYQLYLVQKSINKYKEA